MLGSAFYYWKKPGYKRGVRDVILEINACRCVKTEEILVKYLNIESEKGEFRCLSPHPLHPAKSGLLKTTAGSCA